jgi:hypothetical protein
MNRVLAMALCYDACHPDRLKCGFIADELDLFTRNALAHCSKVLIRTLHTNTSIALSNPLAFGDLFLLLIMKIRRKSKLVYIQSRYLVREEVDGTYAYKRT